MSSEFSGLPKYDYITDIVYRGGPPQKSLFHIAIRAPHGRGKAWAQWTGQIWPERRQGSYAEKIREEIVYLVAAYHPLFDPDDWMPSFWHWGTAQVGKAAVEHALERLERKRWGVLEWDGVWRKIRNSNP